MKNNNRNIKIFVAAVIFCIIHFILTMSDILASVNRNLLVYSSNQEQQVTSILAGCAKNYYQNKGSFDSNIIAVAEDIFPPSSSKYCILAVQDNIVYVKDKYTTVDIVGKMSIRQYLEKYGYAPKKMGSKADKTVKAVLENNKTYLVSTDALLFADKEYTLCICTKVDYIIKKNGFDILKIHIFLYLILFSIVFISLTFFLLKENRLDKEKIYEIENDLINSRLIVDKLYEEVVETKRPSTNNFYGFYQKKVIKSVLNKLTTEQSEKSVKIKVKINSPDKVISINLAALLEKLNAFQSISCIWEEDEFLILLLNSTEKEAELFIQMLKKQYQIKYDLTLEMVTFSVKPVKKILIDKGVNEK